MSIIFEIKLIVSNLRMVFSITNNLCTFRWCSLSTNSSSLTWLSNNKTFWILTKPWNLSFLLFMMATTWEVCETKQYVIFSLIPKKFTIVHIMVARRDIPKFYLGITNWNTFVYTSLSNFTFWFRLTSSYCPPMFLCYLTSFIISSTLFGIFVVLF